MKIGMKIFYKMKIGMPHKRVHYCGVSLYPLFPPSPSSLELDFHRHRLRNWRLHSEFHHRLICLSSVILPPYVYWQFPFNLKNLADLIQRTIKHPWPRLSFFLVIFLWFFLLVLHLITLLLFFVSLSYFLVVFLFSYCFNLWFLTSFSLIF